MPRDYFKFELPARVFGLLFEVIALWKEAIFRGGIMKRVAIVYVSLHGQTEKIARHIKTRLESLGIDAYLMNAEDSRNETFKSETDAVILGGPFYMQRLPSSLSEWIPRHQKFLRSRPLAVFTVGLNVLSKKPEDRKKDEILLHKWLVKTGLHPDYTASFAGSLDYTEYNWALRHVMKWISQRAGLQTNTHQDYEFTDWKMVEQFANSIANDEVQSQFSTRQRPVSQDSLRPHSQPLPT